MMRSASQARRRSAERVQKLRIEMSYPMDAETRAFLSGDAQNEKAG